MSKHPKNRKIKRHDRYGGERQGPGFQLGPPGALCSAFSDPEGKNSWSSASLPAWTLCLDKEDLEGGQTTV